jgi:Mce-associated membrane protein
VTVVVEEAPTVAVIPAESPPIRLAPWHIRAGAFGVDVLPGAALVATMALVALTVRQHAVWYWICVSIGGLAILLVLVNRMLLPTITGWSLGRALFGIAVVRSDGTTPGSWRLLLRDLAHLLDVGAVFVGWLWPLWDSRNRTFADILLRTEVRCVEPDTRPNKIRRWTATALLTAAGLCLAGTAVGYGVFYADARAADQTIAQIRTQGPKIVAQMLTYDPKSLRDDFARARSLATDRYRTQLATQQDAVEKGHPVVNEYWVIDSSIQSATPDRATMLLFMQGRRGTAPEQRYISASVRVNFVKDRDSHWLVDDLTVLTKPKPQGNGK